MNTFRYAVVEKCTRLPQKGFEQFDALSYNGLCDLGPRYVLSISGILNTNMAWRYTCPCRTRLRKGPYFQSRRELEKKLNVAYVANPNC